MRQARNRFALLAIVATSLALVCGVPAANAQGAAAPKRGLTEAQVLDLQKQFQAATVAVDTPALGRLMADDAIFVHGSALVQTKAQYLDSLTTGQMKITTYDSKDSKVTFFDGGAVISSVTDVSLAPRAVGAQPFHVQMRVSSVWVAKSAGWQLILIQGTPIQAPPGIRPAN